MKLELVVERREVVPGCGMWMEITREGTLHKSIEMLGKRKLSIPALKREARQYTGGDDNE